MHLQRANQCIWLTRLDINKGRELATLVPQSPPHRVVNSLEGRAQTHHVPIVSSSIPHGVEALRHVAVAVVAADVVHALAVHLQVCVRAGELIFRRLNNAYHMLIANVAAAA